MKISWIPFLASTRCIHATEEGPPSGWMYTTSIQSSKPPPACLLLPLFLKCFQLSSHSVLWEWTFRTPHSPEPTASLIPYSFALFVQDHPSWWSQGAADSFCRGKDHSPSVLLFVCLFSHYYPKGLMENSRGYSQQRWGYSISKLTRSAHQFVSHS